MATTWKLIYEKKVTRNGRTRTTYHRTCPDIPEGNGIHCVIRMVWAKEKTYADGRTTVFIHEEGDNFR